VSAWVGLFVARVDDQYGLILIQRACQKCAHEGGRARLSIYFKPHLDRQFWLDDYEVFFPEERN